MKPDANLSWLGSELCRAIKNALEGMLGESLPAEPGAPPPSPDRETWTGYPLSGGPDWSIRLGIAPETREQTGAALLKAVGLDPDPVQAASTLEETLAQAISALAQSITAKLGREVTAQAAAEAPGPFAQLHGAVHWKGAQPGTLLFSASPALLAALNPEPEPPAANPPGTAVARKRPSQTWELLLDVELPVSISFGRAQLPLKEVVKLTTGSIVELNRSVSEPVEIIVNNCVIARGEVVVVEGNYGVRIDHVISPQERLRTLV